MRRRPMWLVTLLAAVLASPAAADFLEWKKNDLKLEVAGYFQGDVRAFPNWDVDPTLPDLREDATDIRRLRLGLEGEYKALSGEVILDVASLINHAIAEDEPAFSLRQDLKNAYADIALGKNHFLRAGHTKLPVTREYLTSAARIDFLERSLLATGLAPGRDWGLMAGGTFAFGPKLRYLAGVFAGDGWSDDSRASTTGAGRLVLEASRGLEVGVSGSLGSVEANPESDTVEPLPKGLRAESASGWVFFRRMHVDGQRRRLGADVQLAAGPFTLKGEVLHARDERKGQGATFADLPAVTGLGWSGVAIWRLRGPTSRQDESTKAPIDLAVRYESLRFDDEDGASGFEGIGNRARNIRAESARALSGGLSYRPRSWVRLMGNAVLDRYNDALLAPEQGRKGTYVTLLARLQVEVP